MRKIDANLQIQRTFVLLDMVKDRLEDYCADCKDYKEWKEQNPYDYWYPKKFRTNPTELKRLMLVLRQQMIKLEKML